MKNRIAMLSGVVIAIISLMLLMPGIVSARTVPVTITASGLNSSASYPPQNPDLSLTPPGATANVDIDDGDDIIVSISLTVTQWNPGMQYQDHTMLTYTIDFYEINSNNQIAHTVNSYITVYGISGFNSIVIPYTYSSVNVTDTMRIDIDLDLLFFSGDPPGLVAWCYASPTTVTLTAI